MEHYITECFNHIQQFLLRKRTAAKVRSAIASTSTFHQVLHCASSDVNAQNGSGPIVN